MKKYAFLVHHKDYLDFLRDLRDLGVLHIRYRKAEPSDLLMQREEELDNIRHVFHALKKRNVKETNGKRLTPLDGLDIVQYFLEYSEELEQLEQQKRNLKKELEFLKPWGQFTTASLDKMEKAGLTVRFFTCATKQFQEEWQQAYPLHKVSTLHRNNYFVTITPQGQKVQIEAEEIQRPEAGPGELKEKLKTLTRKIDAINAQLDQYAVHGLPAVEAALQGAGENTQLAAVIEKTQKAANESLMLLKGFAPAERDDEIAALCDRKQVPYLSEKPLPQDSPPVLLKNSFFTRLFEPIGKMFSLPAYRELDLTPFFAPFFMLFFGFCLGDAGYGIVILLGATLYKFRADPSYKPVVTLVQFFGAATILFGLLTGTLFGINLLETKVSWLEDLKSYMLNSDQTFQLALVFGGIQIVFGLFLQALNKTRQFGFTHALASYGWIILLLSILDLGLLERTGEVAKYGAWVGVGMILFFNDLNTGILGRLGKGIWELYGLIGVFGDLMSYIRLFALGISSAILGLVVNDIALQIRDGIPYLGPVLFIVFLVVGHGANMMIAALGAFVHPLRLTFVEFYKHAGFAGGGKPYQPFSTGQEETGKR